MVRGAIAANSTVFGHLYKIYQFVTKHKKMHTILIVFKNLKCRLRLHNLTRWGSQFICLEAIFKICFLVILFFLACIVTKAKPITKLIKQVTIKTHHTFKDLSKIQVVSSLVYQSMAVPY